MQKNHFHNKLLLRHLPITSLRLQNDLALNISIPIFNHSRFFTFDKVVQEGFQTGFTIGGTSMVQKIAIRDIKSSFQIQNLNHTKNH